jgi:hypothetical protein
MILVNGCSFTSGEESPVAWPSFVPNTVNIATPGASNDYILRSTVEYIDTHNVSYAIIAWTSPNRIEISGKHLTPGSSRKYGDIVDAVFKDWDYDWAYDKFCTQASVLHGYLEEHSIKHFFVSAFDIQSRSRPKPINCASAYLGWPSDGMVEWMGDCPKGEGGHPLELGHQRIAEKINEHIGNLGWVS